MKKTKGFASLADGSRFNKAQDWYALVVSWPDIQAKTVELKAEVPEQLSLFDLM